MIDIPNKPSFRVGEAAKLFNVSPRTIYNLIEVEKIKDCVKIGGSLRIPRQSLIDCQEKIDPMGLSDCAA